MITPQDKLRLLLNLLEEITYKYDEILKYNQYLIKRLEEEARTDVLTGLLNRRAVEEEVKKEINRIRRHAEETLCLGILDLDNFKKINDNFGHNEGDKVLKRVAKIIRSSIRNFDIAGRWGGDEFLIGIINCSCMENSKCCMNCPVYYRMVSEIKKIGKEYGIPLSASFGTVFIPWEALDFEKAIKLADLRLYKAKDSGKGIIINFYIERELKEKELKNNIKE
jgi:diguanylate cyclase (GGDEF)-like protein